MIITITIDTDSAPFQPACDAELARVLARVPAKVVRILQRAPGCLCTAPEADDTLRDSNGNRCGTIELSTGPAPIASLPG